MEGRRPSIPYYGATYLIQRPPRIARKSEIHIQRQVHDILGGISCGSSRLDLGQAIRHEPDAVDQQPVGWALDLKVAEEGVCAEDGEHLVEDVVAFGVLVGGFAGGQVRDRGEGVRWAAEPGSEREEGEIAYQPGLGGVIVEDGVVGLLGGVRGGLVGC